MLPWHHRKTLQQSENALQGWASRNAFRFAASCTFHCTPTQSPENATLRISDTPASWGINEIPGAVVAFTYLPQGAHQCTKDSVQGGSQSHLGGCTLELGRGQRHSTDAVPDYCSFQEELWMYCVWHIIQYRQFDRIQNAGLRLVLGAFCTSHVSSIYTETNEAPLEERQLKLSWIIWKLVPALTTQHTMHTRYLYLGQMEKEEWPDPGTTHPGDGLIEKVSKCMITREEAQAKFRKYCHAQGPPDDVYPDGPKINESWGSSGHQLPFPELWEDLLPAV